MIQIEKGEKMFNIAKYSDDDGLLEASVWLTESEMLALFQNIGLLLLGKEKL